MNKINYYGQLTLIFVCFVCGATLVYSMLLIVLLPLLGLWQIIDFIALWLNTGYQKWYSVYLILFCVGAITLYITFVLPNNTKDHNVILSIIYSWIVACIYLAMRSKS